MNFLFFYTGCLEMLFCNSAVATPKCWKTPTISRTLRRRSASGIGREDMPPFTDPVLMPILEFCENNLAKNAELGNIDLCSR